MATSGGTSGDTTANACGFHMSSQCLAWFTARKISKETLVRNHVSEEHVYISRQQPQQEAAVVFPSMYNGEVVGWKYRTLDRRFGQAGKYHSVWYGIEDTAGQDTVIVVEGNQKSNVNEEDWHVLQTMTIPCLI